MPHRAPQLATQRLGPSVAGRKLRREWGLLKSSRFWQLSDRMALAFTEAADIMWEVWS